MKLSSSAGLALGSVCLVALMAIPAGAQNSPPASPHAPVRYIVSLANRPDHLVRVKLLLDPGASERDLQLPVWNALYQVRDFSQYVNWVRASGGDGHPLPVQKLDKTTWHLRDTAQGAEVEYEIFADQSGPFGAQLNTQHAFFNLAEILAYPVDARNVPVEVSFTDLPEGWHIATEIPAAGDGFTAPDYDHMVDAPVEIGAFQESDFDQSGGHYRVVVDADPSDYDMRKTIAMLRRMVSSATTWMEDRPFQTYLFIYHFPPGAAGNGMEHANGTAIDLSPETLAANPQALAGLTAHEFFHLWNVKRIRPQSLEPIDYTKENYTRALWFSEGMTTTAGNIILLRAGLLDEKSYIKGVAAEIGDLERRPAHLTQSVEESSLDAWLEKYDYYRLPTRSISYYNKGNLLGVLLDLQVREATQGSASGRDVFRWMNEHYAQKGQFFPDTEGVRRAAEAVSHADLGWFFQKYVAGTDEIPWDDFFKSVGMHVAQRLTSVADPGFVATRNFNAALTIAAVTAGSAAERAGLSVGDEIVEINGQPANRNLATHPAEVRPGDMLRVRVRNSQGERDLQWTLGSRQEIQIDLLDLDKITPEQKARRTAWLKGEVQAAKAAHP
ncbi:MAG: M61 family metallopeptidase [Terriglobales bacterium]